MFFFDSYAIIESLDGNPNYGRFAEQPIITTALNLGEAYLHYLRVGSGAAFLELIAEENIECLPVEPADAYRAMRFRVEHSGKRLSFIDCIGYTISQGKGLRFLTGDKEFKEIPGIEWVK